MQNMVQTVFIASASSIQSSDTYMTIETPMFSSPTANLNGVRVTEAFIDEIVGNQDKYIGLPLVADVANLEARKFDRLGHRYDRRNDTYGTQIIGAFYNFKKEKRDDGETVLIGYARVMKRNRKVCSAIDELFAQGGLKFSFEISCGTYTKLQDGTIEIDADEHNCWESMCIVSSPAYPDAVAYQLVAETDAVGKEEAEPMKEDEVKTAEAEINEAPEAENAEVYVTQVHEETEAVHTYDTETGEETHTEVHIEERVTNTAEEETSNEVAAAEESVQAGKAEDKAEAEPEVENTDDGDAKKEDEKEAESEDEDSEAGVNGVGVTAEYEAFMAQVKDMIDTMIAENEALKKEIAELKESMTTKVVAETESAVNPFMAEMSIEAEDKYRLLKEVEPSRDYSRLLD